MGLFWKTDADRAVEALQDAVAEVNMELRWFRDNFLERRIASESEVLHHHMRLAALKTSSENALERVPRHRLSSLSVPWIDGRAVPMMLWIMSYQQMITMIERAERM